MHLLVTIVVGVFNALAALYAAYLNIPRLIAHANIETVVGLAVAFLPFAATAMFAFGKRTHGVWGVAVAFNALAIVGMIALIVFTQTSQGGPSSGAFVGGLAVAGVFSTLNLAYLIWRIPPKTKTGDVLT